ncbi:MAG: hypothetical protein ACJATP_000657 [Candidatus Azotimanducaceae bacterium]|jgi:hypothetical protein
MRVEIYFATRTPVYHVIGFDIQAFKTAGQGRFYLSVRLISKMGDGE